ncbi:GerAB/ArcD/ProY family transporter [Cohnella sp. GCM10027633]|uniref:GerAB/ArcD/ProY family transporter n=1 Tax=unclassified Cohnella TaxID=2636738 RepID=UPI00362E0576
MSSTISPKHTVSPYLVFALVHTMQFGFGFLFMSVQPIRYAGQDAWIAVLLSGVSFHVVLWMMYRILNRHDTDLIHIHRRLFGRYAGAFLNFIFAAYFLTIAVHHLRLYIEIVQVWIFPDLRTWTLALVLLLIVYYLVSGGFRVVVGICFLSLLHHILGICWFFPGPFFHVGNMLPMMDHSLSELLKASKELTFPFLGVEMLFFYYPFIKNAKKSEKWAHWGNATSTVYYLAQIFFSLFLFKYEELRTLIWPELIKFTFVMFPFVDHFEFIGVTSWILRFVPIAGLCLWASSRIVKLDFKAKQTTALPILLALALVAVCFIPGRDGVEATQIAVTRIGFGIVYFYVPLLFLYDTVRTKAKAGRSI